MKILRGVWSMKSRNVNFGKIELTIYRVASIVFLIIMILKLIKLELKSW
jgi:hypothetical protein